MADQERRRRGVPKRALIGPLVMLAAGVATGAVLWRFLTLAPAPADGVSERLSTADRHALADVLRQGVPR